MIFLLPSGNHCVIVKYNDEHDEGDLRMRYIQAAVSDEDHTEFKKFAFNHEPQLTLNELIELSVKKYIETYKADVVGSRRSTNH